MTTGALHAELKESGREALLAMIVEAAPLAIVVADAHGRIIFANAGAQKTFGYTQQELLALGVDALVPAARREAHRALREGFFRQASARPMGVGRDLYVQRKDGHLVPVEVALTPIDEYVLAVVVDISERTRLEQRIARSYEELEQRVQERTAELARTNAEKEVLLRGLETQRNELERLSREDPLTGLANRREFDRHLHTAILYSQRHDTPLAVAMLDLDRFKRVNDGWGHSAGDAVLEETGRLLRRECRAIDVVARYGGEEFVLALPHADLPAALAVCERIRNAFATFDWNALVPGLALTISCGISIWSRGRTDRDLLAEADENLYRAKQHGRNRVVHADYPTPTSQSSDRAASGP